jgi:ring-1,2-phenylacetyl-CoA epoxidase subunit PaaD
MFDEQTIWQALEDVKDPEIPVVSVVELGIVREVVVDGEDVVV